jgi:type I restriction enzyme S subunit
MTSLTIPPDWTVQPLGSICAKPEYGLTDTASAERVGPRFVRITDIQGGEVAWDSVPFCRCSGAELDRHRIRRGDLLIARIGATTGKTFLVRDCPEEAVFASYLIRVRPSRIHDRYLYYFCQSEMYWDHINAEKNERLKGGVNSSVLTQLPVVVPPPNEQLAIADVLGNIESAARIASLNANLFRELKTAMLDRLFRDGLRKTKCKSTEIGDVPETWKVTTLGSLCERGEGFIQTGPFGSQLHAHEYQADGRPVINPTHLEGNRISHSNVPRVSQSTADRLERHKVETGDILFGRRGEIGRHGLVSQAEAGWICGTGCFLVRARCAEIDNTFLSYFLSTSSAVAWLVTHAVGMIMPNLNNTVLNNLPVAVPDIEEQREIVGVLEGIDRKINVNQSMHAAAKKLFGTLLHKLMTGAIRIGDINFAEVNNA